MIQILVGLIQTSLHQSNLEIKAMLATPFKSVLLRTKLKPPSDLAHLCSEFVRCCSPAFLSLQCQVHLPFHPPPARCYSQEKESAQSGSVETLQANAQPIRKSGHCAEHPQSLNSALHNTHPVSPSLQPEELVIILLTLSASWHRKLFKAPGLSGCFLSQMFQSLTA